MITPEEFEYQWTKKYNKELVRATSQSVESLNIPEETKHWLTVVGLPKRIYGVMVDGDSLTVGIPLLSQIAPNISNPDFDMRDLYVLANGHDICFLCVDFNGKLWVVNMHTLEKIFFLNSSMPQFAATLLANRRFHCEYGIVQEKYQALPNQEQLQEERFDELEKIWEEWGTDLTQIDAAAMEQHAFWFQVVNQFVLG